VEEIGSIGRIRVSPGEGLKNPAISPLSEPTYERLLEISGELSIVSGWA
jgi:hypothetical protein